MPKHRFHTMLSLFQTASGSWHWGSIMLLIGWLVAGGLMGVNLYINRNDRIRAEAKQTELKEEVQAAKKLGVDLAKAQAPWEITEEEKLVFTAFLKDAPKGKVVVEYIRSDEKRVYGFAQEIAKLLKESGYEVWGYMPGFEQAGSAPLIGVQIQIKDERSNIVGGFVQRAFKEIGINAGGVHRTNNNYEDDMVVIWIGTKP